MDIQDLTGAELGFAPYIEEQVAIEATNGLRGAEIGLRGFRSRLLLRRIWENITGEGQERIAAWGYDLAVVQKATLSIVNKVMAESSRTKKCMVRVLNNLHQVNADLDELQKEVPRINAMITAVREELLAECNKIALDAELALYLTRREAMVRILRDRYQANALHQGTGELVGAAMYLAQHVRYFSSEPVDQASNEKSTALAIINRRLGNQPIPLTELVYEALISVEQPSLEAVAMVTGGSQGPLGRVLSPLMERRLAGLMVDRRDINEAITVVRQLRDPDHRLEALLLYPREFVEILADELEN